MKLTETADHQRDDSTEYGEPILTITFTSREDSNNEIIEKNIDYAYVPESESWVLHHYTERRASAQKMVSERNWRTVHDVHWSESEFYSLNVDVPDSIVDQLNKVTSMNVITLEK